MKPKNRRLIRIVSKVFLWIILIICTGVFVGLLCAIIESCWYKYPMIKSWLSFLCCICSVFLPAFVIFRSATALIHGNLRKAFLNIVLFIPVYILSFVLSAVVSLGVPAICSYSSKPEDFGCYDARPSEILKVNPPKYYPNTVPDNAQDVRYVYYYSNASAETLYIAVSWQSSTQEIRELMTGIKQNEINHIGNNQVMILCTGGYYNNAIFVDYNDYRICYVITSPWMSFPCSLDEVFVAH